MTAEDRAQAFGPLQASRTALLTTSTILPQMQGAMSATQDEIAWAMTFMSGCSEMTRAMPSRIRR